MTWTLFRHNIGPNETKEAQTRSGKFQYVAVQAEQQTAITWWEDEFDADPTRMDGWPETEFDEAWFITSFENEDGLLDHFPNIEVESGGIGVRRTRPRRMKDLRTNDKTLVVQQPEVESE